MQCLRITLMDFTYTFPFIFLQYIQCSSCKYIFEGGQIAVRPCLDIHVIFVFLPLGQTKDQPAENLSG